VIDMAEKIITLFFLLGSSIYLFFAQQFAFGTLNSPKSGFLPTLSGIIALLLSLILFYNQLRSNKKVVLDKVNWTKFIFIIIGLLFYVSFLNILGYFAATFIFLFYLFKIADTAGWLMPLLVSFSSSAIFYLIFANYLSITLP
jgi:putative tricarboxylic transport membrane protein